MSTYPTDPVPMSDDPEVLRRQIEQTRSNLSRDVDALGEAASPGNVAKRQAEKVGDTVLGAGRSLKNTVMGSDEDYSSGPGVGERVGELAGSARDTVTSAPAQARRQTRGNPMAAGLVALGAGWLLGSLLPGSQKERELAVAAKDQVQDSGLVEEAKAVAQEVVEQVKPQAQEAVDQVKDTAADSVETVKQDATSAAEDVKASAADSRDAVQEQRDHA